MYFLIAYIIDMVKDATINANFPFVKCIFCWLPIYHLIPLKSTNINMIKLPHWSWTSSLVNHCYGRLGFPLLCIECYLWCLWNANRHLLLVYDENISYYTHKHAYKIWNNLMFFYGTSFTYYWVHNALFHAVKYSMRQCFQNWHVLLNHHLHVMISGHYIKQLFSLYSTLDK